MYGVISLKKIGRLCGVSESTVSKALKDHPQVKAATRERIQMVARKYNYQPNAMVECMQTGRSKTIGIAYNKFNDMFAGQVMQGIHQTLYRNGYETLIICWDLIVGDGADVLNKFSRRRVDGLLLFPMEKLPSPYYLEQLQSFHNPILMIDQTWAGNEYDFVGSDDQAGAFQATEHLIRRGLSKIGNVCYGAVSSGIERRKGFETAMSENGLTVRQDWLIDITDCLETPYQKIYELLRAEDRPEALVCFNDTCAFEAAAAAYDLDIKIPQQLSLIGFGDLDIASKMRPRLTTVHQSPELIGRKAAQLLLDKISRKEGRKAGPEHCVVPVELIERESVR